MMSILQKIAKENHTTESEVRKAIDEAIAAAIQKNDPETREIWDRIPHKGAVPSAEELVLWVALQAMERLGL